MHAVENAGCDVPSAVHVDLLIYFGDTADDDVQYCNVNRVFKNDYGHHYFNFILINILLRMMTVIFILY